MVDTATLAVWLGVHPRTVRRMVTAGELKPLGQFGRGGRGRPGWWFDLDNLRGEEATVDDVEWTTSEKRKPGETLVIDEAKFEGTDADGNPILRVTKSHFERGELDDHSDFADIGT